MQTAFDSGWGEPEPTPVPSNKFTSPTSAGSGGFGQTSSSGFGANSSNSGGAAGFTVQQDEEFGGWSHASPIATTPAAPKQGGGLGGTSDDLFGNVWG